MVLSSIRAIICHVENIPVTAQRQSTLKKLSAPLVSLVSSSIPEAQYVGLKNIRIILERYPSILSKELRVFFIKYSDPLYLKLEKLDIMIRLANESNSDLLLGELREYAMEFEPALVTRAIKSIGAVAIQLSGSVVKAVNFLNDIIDQRGGDLIINESTIVLTNILRRYPGKSDLTSLIIPIISNHTVELDKPEALADYVWILGEYPKYFSNLHEKLESLIKGFLECETLLQLNILTTVVKINAAIPGNKKYSSLLQQILELATKECENADVRDKAYIYWRLLSSSTSNSLQKKIILAKLPPIESTIPTFSPHLLEQLLKELSTLSSVYHKPAKTFIDPSAYSRVPIGSNEENVESLKNLAKQEIIDNSRNEDLLNFDDDKEENGLSSGDGKDSGVGDLLSELNDLFTPTPTKSQQTSSTNTDILELFNSAPQTNTNSVANGIENLHVSAHAKENKGVNNDLLDLF